MAITHYMNDTLHVCYSHITCLLHSAGDHEQLDKSPQLKSVRESDRVVLSMITRTQSTNADSSTNYTPTK